MSEWMRLTPPETYPAAIAEYKRDDKGHVITVEGVGVVFLSDPEALAFAHQLPEVRALAEALHWALEWVGPPRFSLEPNVENEWREDEYAARQALILFEDVED